MTTQPPMLTGLMPDLLPGPSGLPPVRWCISVLEWVGWCYHDTKPFNGFRTYYMVDPGGCATALTTYGLRRAAVEMWHKYAPLL